MIAAPSAAVPAPWTTSRRRTTVTLAAALALAIHLWGLYRDHGPPTLRWFPESDKVEHLVGFGLPCFLVLLALQTRSARVLDVRTVVVVAGIFAAHAVVSEILQGLLYTTRSGDPLDALADLVGTALGVLGYVGVRRRWARGRA